MTAHVAHPPALTEAQRARIAKCWKDGVELAHIAERFGVTESCISQIAKRMGLTPRHHGGGRRKIA